MNIRKTACRRALHPLVVSLAGLVLAAGVVVARAGERPLGAPAPAPRFKAVAFDYFVLFNPDSIVPIAERAFPGRGRELTTLWRIRQFEYSWLRSLTGRYVDFFAVTKDALVYAAAALNLELTPEATQHLLDAFLRLTPWPDTAGALRQLKASGIRVITLSNFSPAMLRENTANAGLLGFFEALVSTDVNHSYKPDPRAYRLGEERLHLARREILFAAFGGWDAAGAHSFGYPTVWVNRFHQPFEELGARPDRTVDDLGGVLEIVQSSARAAAR